MFKHFFIRDFLNLLSSVFPSLLILSTGFCLSMSNLKPLLFVCGDEGTNSIWLWDMSSSVVLLLHLFRVLFGDLSVIRLRCCIGWRAVFIRCNVRSWDKDLALFFLLHQGSIDTASSAYAIDAFCWVSFWSLERYLVFLLPGFQGLLASIFDLL